MNAPISLNVLSKIQGQSKSRTINFKLLDYKVLNFKYFGHKM